MAVAPTPPAEIEPQADPEQVKPETLHVITGLGFEPATAVNSAENPALVAAVTDDGPATARVKRLVSATAAAAA
jgi:hypothetical protein